MIENYEKGGVPTITGGDLSLKAMGLVLCIVKLNSEGKDMSIQAIKSVCKDGDMSIRSALNELEDIGLLVRKQVRDKNGKLAGCKYVLRGYGNVRRK